MENVKPQWKKRVELVQFFYSCLVSDDVSPSLIRKKLLFFDLDENQLQTVEYVSDNLPFIVDVYVKSLSEKWSWPRLSLMVQSILLVAYAESVVHKLSKPIIIDQALVTADRFGQVAEKKFINAILDKVLKSDEKKL